MEIIVNRIKENRARLNLTQDQIAKEIGVSRVTLGKIENGSNPGLLTALKLADAFEIGINELFNLKTK